MHGEEESVFKEAAESNMRREQSLGHKGGQDFLKKQVADGSDFTGDQSCEEFSPQSDKKVTDGDSWVA